ncbi:hypothetical protein ZHAS_00006997 [Anopheles sinensis]|uniref:BTB domain-containing protein n=1 Tax=Anopheles sinensis TaxID=74873 RepID=A0A084VNF6_ANOSI|nr:hypothetical protein ZHAS_00006997 [Anopheles sinensis]
MLMAGILLADAFLHAGPAFFALEAVKQVPSVAAEKGHEFMIGTLVKLIPSKVYPAALCRFLNETDNEEEEEEKWLRHWNDFQSSILSSFRHLRDEEDFVDVTIACDSRSFTAHKVVLSACSPYFRKLLKANPCEHPIVILRDVRSEDIENLLRFMYNGEVHIGQDQLSDFLKTAQLLQVRGLADVTTGNPTGGRTSANSSMLNSSLSTPAVQELKASPTSTSLPWELPEDNNTAPPPQKRTKSSELYRKQHGLSPDDPIPLDLLPIGQHPLTRERDRSKDKSKDHHHHHRSTSSEHDLHHHHHHRERDRSLELRESLLGQALEGGPTLTVPSKHPDLISLQAAASGDDSNSSDNGASDHGEDDELNGNLEHTRPSFPFLGLQGIPGLIPGPSGIGDNFGEYPFPYFPCTFCAPRFGTLLFHRRLGFSRSHRVPRNCINTSTTNL